MGKQTGIGMNLYVDEYNLSGDVGAVDAINTSRAMLDVTGIDKDGAERLPGLSDSSLSFTSFYNPTNAHTALSGLGTAAVQVTVTLGTAIGDAAASLAGAQANYNGNRGQDGSLVFTTEAQQTGGTAVIWGHLLTAGLESIASAGTAASTVDNGVATTGGAAAYLHCTSIGSGTATVIVQDSADDSNYAGIGTFTAVSAATSERIATTGTAVRQYTRLVTTGTFGTAVIAVNLVRNP